MKFKSMFFTVSAVLIFAAAVYAAQPGTTDDPLVSKSYVEKLINEALKNNSSAANTANTDTAAGTTDTADTGKREKDRNSDASLSSYTPVNINVGQKLIGEEGTEIILRSGRGFGYIPTESGIVDITDGKELFHNAEIMENHMLVIPRDDGRGIRVVEDAWFLVKGGYKVIN